MGSLLMPFSQFLLNINSKNRLESVLKLDISGKPSGHEFNHSGVDEGQSGFGVPFEVF